MFNIHFSDLYSHCLILSDFEGIVPCCQLVSLIGAQAIDRIFYFILNRFVHRPDKYCGARFVFFSVGSGWHNY